ncbi:MAG: hypothetical protein MK116_08125 [Phycisphaerales bacterium]|nr:hypothetical protein [Phycisphaerales bacterium]
MSTLYQVRRGAAVGPDSYSLEQVTAMLAGGSLRTTDEVSIAGEENWQPIESVAGSGGGGAAVAVAPPPAAPAAAPTAPAPAAPAAAPATGTGKDHVKTVIEWMPANRVRWIFRGCLIGVLVLGFFPWAVLGPRSVMGLDVDPGLIACFLVALALGLSWAPKIRPWTFIGSGLAFLITFGAVTGILWGNFKTAGNFSRALSNVDIGWTFWPWLAALVMLVATAFGLIAFLQHLRNSPRW